MLLFALVDDVVYIVFNFFVGLLSFLKTFQRTCVPFLWPQQIVDAILDLLLNVWVLHPFLDFILLENDCFLITRVYVVTIVFDHKHIIDHRLKLLILELRLFIIFFFQSFPPFLDRLLLKFVHGQRIKMVLFWLQYYFFISLFHTFYF